MGLAANSMGGSVLYVEAAVVEKAEGKGNLKLTGALSHSLPIGALGTVILLIAIYLAACQGLQLDECMSNRL